MKTPDFFELKRLVHFDAMQRKRYASECEGKMKYESFVAANRAIRLTTEGRVVAFRCEQCSGWHLGRSLVRDRRVARETA